MGLARKAVAASIGISAAVFAGGTAFAAGGYGPTAPTGPTNAPGGFTTISEVTTFTASGGSMTTPAVGSTASIQVPAGAFSAPVQVEVTTPQIDAVNSALPQLGFAGYSGVAALGIKALDQNGQPVRGAFAKPLSITLVGPSLGKPGEKVVQIDGPNSAETLTATLGSGSVTFQIPADPDIVIVNPKAGTITTPSGATSVHTGKPLAAERDLALGLVGAGLGIALLSMQRRRRRYAPASR